VLTGEHPPDGHVSTDAGTLGLVAASRRVGVDFRTLKAWHAAGLISALEVGRAGKAWRFDAAIFDREVAALPRCAYSGGCERPVAEAGVGCNDHRLPVETEGKPRPTEIVEKVARALRKHRDGDYFCEACGALLKERKGWRIAKRKAEAGEVLCRRCARRNVRPWSKGRWRYCPTCGGGPDWIMPFQEEVTHCHRCFRSAPDVRAKKSEARRRYLATPEGSAAQELALQSAWAFTTTTTAALLNEGLAPTQMAAELLYRAPSNLPSVVTLERREFGRRVRLGVNARDVLKLSPNPDARRILSKPLAVLNGSDPGRPRALSDAELAMVVELRSADPITWSWRKLADKVNAGRPPGANRVTHMTIKNSFERVTASSAVPL
jgi:hypothetical protein